MERLFERKEILLSFRKFKDFSSDLFKSDYATFNTRLAIFIDFCERDKVMGFITSQLKRYDFAGWMEEFKKSGGKKGLEYPLNEDDRISLFYQILLKINAKEVNFLAFSVMAFGSKTVNELIQKFNEAITKPLVRDLDYKLEEKKVEIAASEDRQIPQELLVIITAENISNSQIAIGANIKQIKVSRDMELDALVNKLADLILIDKSLKEVEKEDLLSDVESMKIEMQKNNPIKRRIMEYLDNFVTVASLLEISQKTIEYISTSKIFG